MAERSDTSAAGIPADQRLDSWKAIAGYLGRDVTTVQRWEKREGLPVHRHLHDKRGSVYAFRRDLDAWWQSRGARLDQEELEPAAQDGLETPTSPPAAATADGK